jgi:hypothetical protein
VNSLSEKFGKAFDYRRDACQTALRPRKLELAFGQQRFSLTQITQISQINADFSLREQTAKSRFDAGFSRTLVRPTSIDLPLLGLSKC